MSDQWVSKQGFLVNSSGRYRQGDTPPCVIEQEEDSQKFELAKNFKFFSSPEDAWAIGCCPNLSTLLYNEKMDICVGIEIEHAESLLRQLKKSIADYYKVRVAIETDPKSTNKILCSNGGITLTERKSE